MEGPVEQSLTSFMTCWTNPISKNAVSALFRELKEEAHGEPIAVTRALDALLELETAITALRTLIAVRSTNAIGGVRS